MGGKQVRSSSTGAFGRDGAGGMGRAPAARAPTLPLIGRVGARAEACLRAVAAAERLGDVLLAEEAHRPLVLLELALGGHEQARPLALRGLGLAHDRRGDRVTALVALSRAADGFAGLAMPFEAARCRLEWALAAAPQHPDDAAAAPLPTGRLTARSPGCTSGRDQQPEFSDGRRRSAAAGGGVRHARAAGRGSPHGRLRRLAPQARPRAGAARRPPPSAQAGPG